MRVGSSWPEQPLEAQPYPRAPLPARGSAHPAVPSSEGRARADTAAPTAALPPPRPPGTKDGCHCAAALQMSSTQRSPEEEKLLVDGPLEGRDFGFPYSLFLPGLLPAWSRQCQYSWCQPARISLDPLSCSFASPCLLTVLEDFQSERGGGNFKKIASKTIQNHLRSTLSSLKYS